MDSDLWVVVDLGEVMVHIFSKAGRDYYQLEGHWRDLEAARRADIPYVEYLDRKVAERHGITYEEYLDRKPMLEKASKGMAAPRAGFDD